MKNFETGMPKPAYEVLEIAEDIIGNSLRSMYPFGSAAGKRILDDM